MSERLIARQMRNQTLHAILRALHLNKGAAIIMMDHHSIVEENERIFPKIVALLQEELGSDLLGIQATGSRIHGTPGPTSDLDVNVVVASPRRRRRNMVLDGLEIEMFFNPIFQVHRYFAAPSGNDKHMYAFGQIIYDPQGVLAKLQAEAKALWEAGPAPLSGMAIWEYRYHSADLLRDLQDVGERDEATSNILITEIVNRLIEAHYLINRRWPQKTKRRLSDLQNWDPYVASLVRTALVHPLLPERLRALDQISEHVLAPIGGLMPLEWEFGWEKIEE